MYKSVFQAEKAMQGLVARKIMLDPSNHMEFIIIQEKGSRLEEEEKKEDVIRTT